MKALPQNSKKLPPSQRDAHPADEKTAAWRVLAQLIQDHREKRLGRLAPTTPPLGIDERTPGKDSQQDTGGRVKPQQAYEECPRTLLNKTHPSDVPVAQNHAHVARSRCLRSLHSAAVSDAAASEEGLHKPLARGVDFILSLKGTAQSVRRRSTVWEAAFKQLITGYRRPVLPKLFSVGTHPND